MGALWAGPVMAGRGRRLENGGPLIHVVTSGREPPDH